MRDQDDGHLERPEQRHDLLAQRCPQGRVDVRPRLVEEHELGLRREGAGERNPLLLPAGELVRVPVLEAVEPDVLHELVQAGAAALTRGTPKPMFSPTVKCGKSA